MAKRYNPHIISSYGVDKSKNRSDNLNNSDIHTSRLGTAIGLNSHLLRIVVHQMSVREIQAMLCQIGLAFHFIPHEHDLIVSTIK